MNWTVLNYWVLDENLCIPILTVEWNNFISRLNLWGFINTLHCVRLRGMINYALACSKNWPNICRGYSKGGSVVVDITGTRKVLVISSDLFWFCRKMRRSLIQEEGRPTCFCFYNNFPSVILPQNCKHHQYTFRSSYSFICRFASIS